MRLLVVADAHLYKSEDGSIWTPAIYKYEFWTRYMNVYEEIVVACRMKSVPSIDKKWLRVDGPCLRFIELPFFQTKKEFLKSISTLLKKFNRIYNDCDVTLFRMPCPLGILLYLLKKPKIPTGVEVVYNPKKKIRLKDGWFSCAESYLTQMMLKKICKNANGVSYVTENNIQNDFPSYAHLHGEDRYHFTTYYSTITLKKEVFTGPRVYPNKGYFEVMHSNVAMNHTDRKGEIILLKAIKYARDLGIDIRGIFLGDGPSRVRFEEVAMDLNITQFVTFTGLVPSETVYSMLERADIYVLPSKGEGLPRGILEAMAKGMPCIASPVGGIPEILQSHFLIPSDDYAAYGKRIVELATSKELYESTSIENYEKALKYENSILQSKRDIFYKKLKELAMN